MKKKIKGFGFYAVLLVLLAVAAISLLGRKVPEKIVYSDIVGYFENKQVDQFEIKDSDIFLTLKDGKEIKYNLLSVSMFYDDMKDTIREQRANGTLKNYEYSQTQIPWLLSILPYGLLAILMIGAWIFMMRRMGDGGAGGKMNQFGRARTKLADPEKNRKTFADVAGADEEKEELREVVDFLKNPKKYVEIGARIPKGILLVGPPGTGKTLLAKAVAGEAGVPFFSISGSDFVEMFVGVGASRVRDMFEQAKKNLPSILFIDEIDAVGRHRGAGLGGGHDEREQTLNQLLVEMDGFGENEGVIIIAATNRPDILDPALLRPGRFDRQIVVGSPDIKGREEILRVHAKGKPLASDVNLSNIAKTTAGFTGADLENLLNEAALLAARRNARQINGRDVEEASVKVMMGPEKKSRVVIEKEKKLTSYHEAGHAIVSHFLPLEDPVHEISIIPRGRAGGYTMYRPTEDRTYSSKEQMIEQITSLLGGRVAEALVLTDVSTGASNDLERATKIARAMVTKYGMSDKLGPIVYGSDSEEVFIGRDFGHAKNYSEKVSAEIDAEIKEFIEQGYRRAEEILTENMATLHKVAGTLYTNEKISGEEFEAFFDKKEEPESSEKEEAVLKEEITQKEKKAETEISAEKEKTEE